MELVFVVIIFPLFITFTYKTDSISKAVIRLKKSFSEWNASLRRFSHFIIHLSIIIIIIKIIKYFLDTVLFSQDQIRSVRKNVLRQSSE